ADVLAALRVVRRGREEAPRPTPLPLLGAAMELRGVDAELVRLAADLVPRDEQRIRIEGRVLDALRVHRSGELLEAQRELALERTRDAQQQEIGEEVEERGVEVGAVLLGGRD